MLIVLFLVSHFNFLFVTCGRPRLSWLPISFLLHVKYTLSYRIVPMRLYYSSDRHKPQTKHHSKTDRKKCYLCAVSELLHLCLSTRILTVYFQYMALKLFGSWCQPTVHKQNGHKQQACSQKLNVCYDTKLYYYLHITTKLPPLQKFLLTEKIPGLFDIFLHIPRHFPAILEFP